MKHKAVVTVSYKNERAFEKGANKMAKMGMEVALVNRHKASPSCLAVLLTGGLAYLVRGTTIMVTYRSLPGGQTPNQG